jgi:periplasmic protein CpxP/Spy
MSMFTPATHRFLGSLVLALAGAATAPVLAMPPGAGPGGMGIDMGGGAMMGGMLPRLLDRVNATPQQRTQIQQIVERSRGEHQAQRQARQAMQDEAMTLFSQPTVDANAVEALRQKQMAIHDAASKRMTEAMIEISRVLSPEQRKQMAEHMRQRREMMQRHYRERQAIDTPKG